MNTDEREVDILSILLEAHASLRPSPSIPLKRTCKHPDDDCADCSYQPCSRYERCPCGDPDFPWDHCHNCVHREDCHIVDY